MRRIFHTGMSAGLDRRVLASVLALTLGFGSAAFIQPAPARAEWDIEAFDACMKNMQSANDAAKEAYCCVWSGGDYHSGKCWAPANLQGPGTSTKAPAPPQGAIAPEPPTVATLP
jgi:hypothetical protein